MNFIRITYYCFFGISTLALIGYPDHTHAQSTSPIQEQLRPTIPSANAMNLGLFNEIPVSYSSGIPDISIPLYNIKFKGTTVPVTLSCHPSGVRADVHPSWVGLGWSMLAGGSINRVIKGGQDEVNYMGIIKGYYFNSSANNNQSWSSTATLSHYGISNDSATSDNNRDTEPDEFSFSFPGHSGKFFLDQTGAWRVQCDQPVKVVFQNNDFIAPFVNQLTGSTSNSPATFNKFTIIDEKGIQYVFGEASAIEYSDQLIHPNGAQFNATSWMLKRIISPDGLDVIEFNYDRGPFQASMYREFFANIGCGGFQSVTPTTGGQLISPVYLRSIVYNRQGLEIDFSMSKSNELAYSDQDFNDLFDANQRNGNPERSLSTLVSQSYQGLIPYFNTPPGSTDTYTNDWNKLIYLKLDNVSIKNTVSGQVLKTVDLLYDNNATQRLRLSGVNIKDGGAQVVQKYGLKYYEAYALPGYLKVFGDHWGFNNNIALPASAQLPISLTSDFGTTYKLPADIDHAVTGTLKSITYPTGGSSAFEYELNQFAMGVDNGSRAVESLGGTAGGLRIRKIHTISNNSPEEVKTYYYVRNFTNGVDPTQLISSGILQGIPTYNFTISGYDLANRFFTMSGFTSSPIYPLTASSTGQHVSYSNVTEQRSDGSYTNYVFTNNDNGYNDLPPVNVFNAISIRSTPYNDRSFERGKMISSTVYTDKNLPVHAEVNQYKRPDFPDSYAARAVTQTYGNNCNVENADNGLVARAAYEHYYYPLLTSQRSVSDYDSNGQNPVTDVQSFTYNDETKAIPTSVMLTNSQGDQRTTYYTYPFSIFDPVSVKMAAVNMLTYPIQSVLYTPTQVTTSSVNYNEWPASSGAFYPQTIKKQVNAKGNEETLVQVNAYDSGNIKQQTLKGGLIQSFEWGYNKTLQIARVLNAQNSQTTTTQTVTSNGLLTGTNTVTFTTSTVGDIVLAIQNIGAPASPFAIAYNLGGRQTGSSTLCFSFNNPSYCGPNSPPNITYSNMPVGTYTLNIATVLTPGGAPPIQAGISYTYQGSQTTSSGIKEFFVENFEESSSGTTGAAHTGKKFYNAGSNPYQVNWTLPNTRAYVISYWHHQGGVWLYSGEKDFSGAITLNDGDGYDDIRIYPKDAQVTTYTYDPLVGLTSEIDEKGLTSYYEYDSFQRLKAIKDKDGNIIKYVDYHYQGQ